MIFNMKPKFEGLTSITKAAIKESGYKETRKIIDGSLFSESDKGLLKLLKDSLGDSVRRRILLDMLSVRTEDPIPLSEIVNVLEKFRDLAEIELTSEDIRLINFTIKYFENWFYEGGWAKISKKQNDNINAYAYFSVPAGIVNLFTKLKDSAESAEEIISFDSEKLSGLQKEVRDFVITFLSKERLETILKQDLNPEKREKIECVLKNRENMLRTFYESEKSVENELKGGRGSSGSTAGDLYLLKTALIAAEMKRREQEMDPKHYVFVPDIEIATNAERYRWFDFSQGKDEHSSMHYPNDRIAYAKFLVEYLGTKKKKI